MKSPRLKVTRVVARIWRRSTALVAALVLLGSLTTTSLARAQEPGSSPSELTPIVEIPEACVPAPSQDRVGPAGAEVSEPVAEPTIDVAPSPEPSASPEFTAEPDPEPSASAVATPEPDPTATEMPVWPWRVDAAPFDDTSVLAWYSGDDTVSARAPPSLTVTGDWLDADSPGIAWDPLAERVSGDALRLQIDKAGVPSGVRVSLFPGDTVLGEFLVDQEGSLDETVSLPGDLAPEIYIVQVALVETVIDSVPTTWRVEAPVRVIDPPPSPSPSPEPSDIASPSPEPSAEVSEPAAPVLCPAAATDVGVTAAMNSAQVSWAWSDEVLGDGDVTFYVEAASDLLDVGPRVVRVPGDARAVTVDGLRNGVDYTFTVYAATDSGSGPPSVPASGRPTTGVEGEVAGVIVTYSSTVQAPAPEGSVPGADAIDAVGLVAGEEVSEGSHVVEFTEAVDISTAQEIAAELTRQPEIIYAEPDLFLFTAEDTQLQDPAVESSEPPLATPVAVPDDPQYSSDQWNLWDTYGISIGDGADAMTDAWAGPRGEGVTVAVIDTGITDHPDLDGQVVDGYDFVSSPEQLASTRTLDGDAVALDGDYVDEATYGSVGRDGNPADPGDWRMVAPTRHSSWHGTKVAGIIAASAGNGEGIAGVAPRASIQPVRALSWRGGLLSDIAASITWASGGSIDGVPANATPSKVINLSFAVDAMCPVALQAAIDGARERGSILVAAAGNAADDAANYAPGNCDGVITVAATTSAGTRAAYSNYGPVIDLAAPGGDSTQPVPTSSNTGTTAPEAPGASTSFGTSIAAAHVSAGAALLAAADPGLTPDDAYETLTGRDYVKDFANPTCDVNPQYACGTGILSLAQIASVASGDEDYAMQFNGTTQGAVAGSTSAFTSNLTNAVSVAAWVRPETCTDVNDFDMVLDQMSTVSLTCYLNTWRVALAPSWGGGYRDTGVTARLNEWQHIAFTRAAGSDTVNFYLNGQLAATPSGFGTGGLGTPTRPLTVGFRSDASNQHFFQGRIDEVRLFNTAITAAQVLSSMHTYGPVGETGLLAYYDFNEGPAGATGTGTIYNRATGATSATNLRTVNGPTYSDIKQTTSNGNNTVVTFPRSYLTAAGGWRAPSGTSSIDYLVVGGGGGGGTDGGSGGGGGSMRNVTSAALTTTGQVMAVTVGMGGRAGVYSPLTTPTSGQQSSLTVNSSVFTAPGGSGGVNVPSNQAGGAGGTGGNATSNGGAGGTAANGANSAGTAGSNGPTSAITGVTQYVGGGGGGGSYPDDGTVRGPVAGGQGGGGAGAAGSSTSETAAAQAGAENSGGGGGGARADADGTPARGPGGWGGSGVVIVRYYTSARSLSVSQQPGSYGVRTGWSTVPKVQVVDGSGSAVALSGVTVTASFNATSGSATLSNATAVTDASGIATFTNLTVSGAPATAGTLTFSADLLASGTSSSFTITGVTLTLPSSAGVSAGTATSMGVGSSAVSDFAASDTVLVTLSTTAGSLSITSSTGLSTVTGYQSPVTAAASSIAFTGTQANVNAALQTLRLNATGSSATVSGSAVLAGTAYYPTNGHYYEVVTPTSSIGWVSAKAAAEARTFNGLTGYLATITSAAENEFIAGKLTNDGWMGASDTTTEGTWKWMTGPESGTTFWNGAASGSAPAGQYANWTSGEPNNSSHAGCSDGEDYGQFYRVTAKWNDLPCASSAAGLLSSYIVEYGGLSGETAYAQSTSSTAVTIANVPGAPTGVTATAGQLTAAVSWTAPTSDGGSAITGYTVTSSPGSFTCSPSPATSTSCTVTGLTAGTDYTFTVVATNVVGSSSSSTASSSVTPFGAVTQFSVTQSGGSTALATQTAGTASSVRVRALDSGGRLNTAYTGTVSLTSTAFSGTVSAVIASGGVVDSVSVTPTIAGSGQVIAASGTVSASTVTTSSASASFTVNPGSASTTTSVVTASSASITANGTSTSTITVTLKDAYSNTLTSSGGTVAVSTTLGSVGSTTNNGDGTYTATLTSSTTAGDATVSATLGGSAISSTTTVAFTPGTAAKVLISAQPVAGASGSVLSTQPVVRIADANGNTVTSSTATVTATASGGTIGGTTSVTAVGGVATFTDLTFTGLTSSSYTLTFDSTGLTSATSNSITPSGGGTASKLVITGSTTQTAGATQNVTITAFDAVGNTADGYSGTKLITFSGASQAPDGQVASVIDKDGFTVAFGATTSLTFTNGVASVSSSQNGVMALYKMETATISVTDGTISSAGSDRLSVTVSGGAASKLAVGTQPAAGASGATLGTQPAVRVVDAYGNLTASTATVTVTASGGTLGGPQATSGIAAVSGVATFTNLTFTGLMTSSYTLTFASTGVASVTSSSITPTGAGTATTIAVNAGNTQTATVLTAVATAPSVIVTDSVGNPVAGRSVTFSGDGIRNPTSSVATNASGIAALTSWTLGTTAGTNTLTATATGLTGSPVTITATGVAGTVTKFGVTMTGGATALSAVEKQAGVPFGVRVSAQDAHGNTNSSWTGTVTLTSAAFVGSVDAVITSNGFVDAVSLTPTVLGSTARMAAASGAITTSTASPTFTVSPGPVASFTVTNATDGAITSQTAGTPFTVKITALDQFGNTATGFTGTATLTATGTVVTNGATTGVTAAFVAGVLSPSIQLRSAGTQVLTATQTTGGSATGSSGSFTVSPGRATGIAIGNQPANMSSGATLSPQPTGRIIDDFGNTVTSSSDSATLAKVGGSSWSTPAGIDGAMSEVAYGNGKYVGFTQFGFPRSSTDGSTWNSGTKTYSMSPRKAAFGRDASGNPLWLAVGTQTSSQLGLIRSSNGETWTESTALQSEYWADIAYGNGAWVAVSNNSGSGTIRTSFDGGLTWPEAKLTSGTFVEYGGGRWFAGSSSGVWTSVDAITWSAASLPSGCAGNGAYGNGTWVTAASSLCSSTDGVTWTDHGSSTAGWIADMAYGGGMWIAGGSGGRVLTSYDGSSWTLVPAATTGFNSSATLQVAAGGGSAVAVGDYGSPQYAARTTTSSTGLSGTTTISASNGLLDFSAARLSGTVGSSHRLVLTSSTLQSVSTSEVTITGAGSAAALSLSRSSAGASSGAAFTTQPQVTIADGGGNTLTSDNSTVVTASVSAGATLVGTTTATAVNGVATFTGLGISGTSGTAYTITYSSGSLTSATQSVTPTAGTAVSLAISRASVGTASGAAFTTQPQIAVKDAQGNTVTSYAASTVTATISAGGTLRGTTTATTSSGVATFSNLGITGTAGTTYTITYSLGAFSPVAASVTVTVGAATAIALNAGNGQTAAAGSAVSTAPSVVLTDSGGNLVPGASVTFAIASGGGSGTGLSATTNASGIATVGSWTLGTTVGTNTMTATVSGATGSPVTFTATGTVGPVTKFGVTSGGSYSAVPTTTVAGTAIGVRVSAQDANGNVDSTWTGTVALTSTAWSGTVNAVIIANGFVDAIAISPTVAGTGQVVRAASGSITTTSASASFAVTAGTVSSVKLTANRSLTPITAGESFSVTLEPADSYGNVTSCGRYTEGGLSTSAGTGTQTGNTDSYYGAVVVTTTVTSTAPTTLFGSLRCSSPNNLYSGSVPITVQGASATSVALTTAPVSSGVSGSVLTSQPVLSYRDTYGNPTSTGTRDVNANVFRPFDSYTPMTFTGTSNLGIAFGDGRWIAATPCSTGSFVYCLSSSKDGVVWSEVLRQGAPWEALTYGNGMWLAISNDRKVYRSTNGLDWSVVSSGSVMNIRELAYGGGVWWAVGDQNGSYWSSNDGTTWTSAANLNTQNIAYTGTGSRFVVMTGTSYRIINGSTVGSAVDLGINVGSVAAGAGAIVTIGSSSNRTILAYSTDGGTTWTTSSASPFGASNCQPYYMAWTGTRFVASGNGCMVQSADGINWLGGSSGNSSLAKPNRWAGGNAMALGLYDGLAYRVRDSLTTTYTASPSSTTATFSGLAIHGPAGTLPEVGFYTNRMQGTATTVSITSAGSPYRLELSRASMGTSTGTAFTTQPQVTVRDLAGNAVTSDNSTVVTASVSSGGTLVGTATATAVNGVATFSNLGLSGTIGTGYEITYSSGSLTQAAQIVTVTAGAPAALALTRQSVGAASGAAFTTQPQVTIRDAAGNTVTTDSSTVITATVSAGGALVGTATATAASGIATFTNLGISGTAGTAYTVTYSSGALTVATQSVAVTAGAASRVVVSTEPVAGVSGAALTTQPVVRVTDSSGNTITTNSSSQVTVTASGGTLSGTSTVTVAGGVGTFSGLTFSGLTSTSYTLTFASSGLTSATSAALTPTGPGAAASIATNAGNAQSATVDTAVAIAPSVKVTDSAGNAKPGTSVTFAVASGGGSLVTAGVVTTDDSGIATSPAWTLGATAGANALTVTASGLAGSPVTFTATGTPGAASKLVMVTQPIAGTSGSAFTQQPVVRITDSFNNTVSGADDTVTVTSSAGGVLGGSQTASGVRSSAGTATFTNLTFGGLASQNYTLTFASGALTSVTSSTFTPSGSGTATSIAASSVDSQTGTAGDAAATAPAVIVRDAAGNPVSGISVTFAVTGGGGSLGGPATVSTSSSGIATAPTWTLGTVVGTNTVTATATGLTGSPVTFAAQGLPGSATRVLINRGPVAGPSGSLLATQPVVWIADAHGNCVTTSTATVSVSASGGSLTGAMSMNATGGQVEFNDLAFSGLVTTDYTLTFASSSLTSDDDTIRPSAPGPATTLTVSAGAGQTAAAGTPVSTTPAVTVTDAVGNPVPGTAVTFAVVSGGGSLASPGSPATVATNASGVATSPAWTLGSTAGSNSLTATSASLSGSPATITGTGTPGAPTALQITRAASGARVGAAFTTQPRVSVVDAHGNVITADDTTVITATISGGASLSGTTTATVVDGVATFSNLGASGSAGLYSLGFTSGSLSTSQPLALAVGDAVALSVTTAAAGATYGNTWSTQPVVRLVDAAGNTLVDDSSSQVTVAVSAGGTLSGTTSRTLAGGVATFSGLSLTGAPATYTLTYSSGALPGVSNSLALGQAAQTITFGALSTRTYGTPAFTVSATASSGLGVTFTSTTTSVCSVSGATVTILAAGTCTIRASQPGNTNYLAASNEDKSFTVNRASQTALTLTSTSGTYGAPLTLATAGGTTGGTVSYVVANGTATGCAQASGVLTTTSAGTCSVTATMADDTNYLPESSPATTVSLAKASPSPGSWSNVTKVYGEAPFTLAPPSVTGVGGATLTGTWVYTSSAPGVATVMGTMIDPGSVGTATVTGTFTPSNSTSYLTATATMTVAVNQATQATLTISSPTIFVHGTSLMLVTTGGSGSGAVTFSAANGTASGCQVSLSGGTSTLTSSSTGTCVVNATKAGDPNHQATSAGSQTVTVAKASQTVAFTSTPPMMPRPFGVYAVTAAASSALPVTLSITAGSPTVCTLSAGSVSFNAAGSCTITAAQGGDGNYHPASSVTQTIVVGALNQSITFAQPANHDFGEAAFSLSATASSGLRVSFARDNALTTNNDNACAVDDSGIVTVIAVGACAVSASQAGNGQYAAASPTVRVFQIVPVPASAPFITSVNVQNASATLTFTPPGFTGGSTITAYQVNALPDGGGAPVSSSGCSASGSPLECTLTGLSNGIGYRFTVQAITATGLGAASPMVPAAGQAAIVSAVRPNAVDHLIAVRGDTTLTAQWTELTTAQLGGGAFTRYDLSIAQASDDSIVRAVSLTRSGDDSYTFTGLTNGVPYVITVVAITTANATPLTGNTAIVSEVPARAPDAVTGTYSATSGTTGVVSWPAPVSDGGSPVTSYTVTMTGTGGPFTCSATPPAMNCAVTGLTRGAAYSIEVSVHNAVGASTDPPVPVTQPNVPAAPVIMTVAPMTVDDSTWFEVTWSVPASNGAPITGYVVTATKRSAMGGMFVRAASADDTQFTCTSSTTECVMLAPGSVRDYAFVVVADNLAGVSAPSAPFVVPDPTPPGPGPVPPVPPAPTPPGPQPAPGPVPPGTTVVEVNGRPDPTASSGPVPTRDAIAITGSSYAMQIEALAADGKPVSLNDDTALVAYVGQRIEVSGTGMRPGTFAAAYVLDPVLAAGARSLARPVQVGTVLVATAESFTGAWRLPSVVQPGEYVLQVVGTLADGSVITVNTGMVVRHPDRRAIVITGQRGAGSTRHVITVQGRTLDLNREAIKPRIRLSGESKYSSGRPVIAQVGQFTWAREVAPRKKAYIYFSSGGIRSNRIIIDKAAPR